MDTNRLVLSGIGLDGSARCRFQCAYCFAADPAFDPNGWPKADSAGENLDRSGNDVLMLAGDTEIFADREKGLRAIVDASATGKSITFATKMSLPDSILSELKRVQDRLAEKHQILSVMVSIPMFSNSAIYEKRVPAVATRIAMVARLEGAGLFPFVGIRPLLPPDITSDADLAAIVSQTAGVARGYITGPYWFSEDVLNVSDANREHIQVRHVDWMPGRPLWNVYEDKERETHLERVIRSHGSVLFERSSDAVRRLRDEAFPAPEGSFSAD